MHATRREEINTQEGLPLPAAPAIGSWVPWVYAGRVWAVEKDRTTDIVSSLATCYYEEISVDIQIREPPPALGCWRSARPDRLVSGLGCREEKSPNPA